ncbi:TetR/AcrR family transcriptional regulator [Corynebacterium sp. YIM 101645]|uniref:TetR/AcrR family transcriptional regulator n=1 Tax=Corynebacterium lemuris TaxID=1859292 RepID=A0ABT2FWH4_9CORY|nr:TetR/AcrR family transcriptional regulator [Corynebacterium lemuris]MCS5479595.1 TetR/AcrR family transcriptional regulator [Corynebacterium lemuris]
MHQKSTAAGVGRRPRFTSDDVVTAALRLGVDRFTLSGIAEELGVRPPAIYRLFPSRGMIVEAAVAVIAGRFGAPRGGTWQEVLRCWVGECDRLFGRYPGFVHLIYELDAILPSFREKKVQYLDALVALGRTKEQSALGINLVSAAVVTAHLREEGMRKAAEGLVRPAWPAVDGIVPPWNWMAGAPVDVEAEVEVIIRGLEGRR